MHGKHVAVARSVLVVAVTGTVQWVNGGDLAPPPGAISPTMKTLVEVEPRIAINATNTPGDLVATFKITADGSYYLTEDLFGEPGKVGIEIIASAVTVDLMGFTLKGDPTSLDGIRGNPTDQHTLAIYNGTFRGWPGSSVDVGLSRNTLIRDLRVIASGANGIKVGNSSVVERCTVGESGASGIQTGTNSRVFNCAANTAAVGIKVLNRSTVHGCMVMNNSGNGIETAGNASVTNCTANTNGAGIVVLNQCSVIDCVANSNSTGDGISAGYASIIRGCVATFNADDGIAATNNGVRISDNSVSVNTGDGIEVIADSWVVDNKIDGNARGIFVSGIDNRIDGNSVTDSFGAPGIGIDVDGSENLIIRNTAAGNVIDFDIAAGNNDAQVIVAGSGFVSTDPWANFSY